MRLVFDRGTLLVEDAPAGIEPRDFPGFSWDENVGALRAPARLAYALAAALRRRGVPLSDAPRPRLEPPSGVRPLALRPVEQEALVAWRAAGRRGVVVAPDGETRVALAAIAQTRTPCLVLVPARARLAEWLAALAEIHEGPLGRFGGGERVLAPLTVATFESARRSMPTVGDCFGMLVVDGAHHVGAAALDQALDMSIAPVRLGLTATPPAPGPLASRLATLVGPTVFELGAPEPAGPRRAPLARVAWRVALDDDDRREYDALVAVYRDAVRAFMSSHVGASWADFLREASRTEEGRRGIEAWRRAARIAARGRAAGPGEVRARATGA
jgi:superfamily II DNA or RNA helicase